MKKNTGTLFILLIAVASLTLNSCKKSSTTFTAPSGSFIWSFLGTNYTADSASMIQGSGSAVIIATSGVSGSSTYRFFEISLHGTVAVGTYTEAGQNAMSYTTLTTGGPCSPFTINITAIGNGKASGNFTGTLPPGPISGSFTDIPVR